MGINGNTQGLVDQMKLLARATSCVYDTLEPRESDCSPGAKKPVETAVSEVAVTEGVFHLTSYFFALQQIINVRRSEYCGVEWSFYELVCVGIISSSAYFCKYIIPSHFCSGYASVC
jgi:hypothetical protein